jgi:surface antigen
MAYLDNYVFSAKANRTDLLSIFSPDSNSAWLMQWGNCTQFLAVRYQDVTAQKLLSE